MQIYIYEGGAPGNIPVALQLETCCLACALSRHEASQRASWPLLQIDIQRVDGAICMVAQWRALQGPNFKAVACSKRAHI